MRRNKEVGRDKEKKTGSLGNVRSCEKTYVEEAKSIRGGRYGGEKAGKMHKGGLEMTCTHEEKSGEWKTRKAMSLSQFGSGKQPLRQRFIDPLRKKESF